MPVDIIEMFWGCHACKGDNRGRFKSCETCGRPREDNSPEWMPDDVSPMAAVRDAALLKKFKGGEDWSCRFCGSSQFRVDKSCAECGARQDGTMAGPPEDPKPEVQPKAELPRAIQKKVPAPPPKVPTRQVGRREPPPPPARLPPPKRLRDEPSYSIPKVHPPYLLGGGILAGLILLGIGLYFIIRPKIVEATVNRRSWTRTIEVERKTLRPDEGWTPTADAVDINEVSPRIHHYKKVLIGSHSEARTSKEECGKTCTPKKGECRTVKTNCRKTPRDCKSQKNGSARCTGGDEVCDKKNECEPDRNVCEPKYCDRKYYIDVPDYRDDPVYQAWFTWGVWRWGPNRKVVSAGIDNPEWPSTEAIALGVRCRDGEVERLGEREETYSVVFRTDDASDYYLIMGNLLDFESYKVGSRYQISVSLGKVVEVLRRR